MMLQSDLLKTSSGSSYHPIHSPSSTCAECLAISVTVEEGAEAEAVVSSRYRSTLAVGGLHFGEVKVMHADEEVVMQEEVVVVAVAQLQSRSTGMSISLITYNFI